MGVRRSPLAFEGQFTQIPNEWVRDGRLSRRARGLLAEVMSHRVGWHISISSLQKAGTEGRDAIRSALTELLEAGYLRRVQPRGDQGRFNEVEYELCEPLTADGKPVSGGFTGGGLPDDGLPDDGESDTKNTITSEDHVLEDHFEPKPGNHRKKPAIRLPDAWSPNDSSRAFARKNKIDINHEIEQFRAHAAANDRKQADWNAAFRLWLGNVVKWSKPAGAPLVDPNAWMNE